MTFGRQHLGESGNESGGQRAFGKEIPQQIGNAKSGQERVVVQAGAKKDREHLIPHQAENAAPHDREADDSGIARDAPTALLRVLRFHNLDQANSYPVA